MTDQPRALVLADALENWPDIPVDLKASAAELRRLHSDNEAKDALLRQAADMLATLPVKHPDQIAPRDALVTAIRARQDSPPKPA